MKLLSFFILFFALISCSHISHSPYRAPAYESALSKRQCAIILGKLVGRSKAESKPTHRHIGQFSHANNVENFHEKMHNLDTILSHYSRDKKYIYDTNGGNVTMAHMIDLLMLRAEGVTQFLDTFKVSTDQELNKYIENLQETIKINEKEINALERLSSKKLKMIYNETEEQNKILDIFNRGYSGHIGELDYFLRLNRVVKSHFYVVSQDSSEKVASLFSNALKKLQTDLEDNSTKKTWRELKYKYKQIFKRLNIKKYYGSLRKTKLLMEWLEDKEFDFIIKVDKNKWQIVEVKNYNKKMTLEHFEEENTRGKSLLDQQLEAKEIIQLLGLQKYFSNAIVFRNGSEPEVKEALRKHNIEVIKDF